MHSLLANSTESLLPAVATESEFPTVPVPVAGSDHVESVALAAWPDSSAEIDLGVVDASAAFDLADSAGFVGTFVAPAAPPP